MSRLTSFAPLLVCMVLLGAGLVVQRPDGSTVATPETAVRSRDIDLYAAVVSRLRTGEDYYVALGGELRSRGYPTVPIFNWRTPTLLVGLSWISREVARTLLFFLGAVLLAMSTVVLSRRPPLASLLSILLMIGAVTALWAPDAIWMGEPWAGVLIGLSVACFRLERPVAGAVVGLLALFVRELAAPYVVLCAWSALVRRQRRQAVALTIGLILYLGLYSWHAHKALAAIGSGDLSHDHSWFYGGGLTFVLSTLRTNGVLLVAPSWLTAVVLAILGAALVSVRTHRETRFALIYLPLFSIIGQPFDFYWGLLIAPSLAFGLSDGVEALADVWQSRPSASG